MVAIRNWMLVANEEEEERLKQHEKRVLAYTNLGDGKVDTPDYQSYYETKYDKNQELETFSEASGKNSSNFKRRERRRRICAFHV